MADEKVLDGQDQQGGKPRSHLKVIVALGAIAVIACFVIGSIWVERNLEDDTEKAVHIISLFYLDELAGRREQVVASNLENCIEEINAALSLMDEDDLVDEEHLSSYQARVKKYYNLDKFAFVGEDRTIYTSRGRQDNLDEYGFDPFTLTGPEVSILDSESERSKKVVIALPVSLQFGDSRLICCFMEIDMSRMLKGISMDENVNGTTYCNLYTEDGEPLASTVLGGVTSHQNILDSLDEATFIEGGPASKVRQDFRDGVEGEATVEYRGAREMISYVPVAGTDWMLTYLVSESIISSEIAQVSEGILRRSILQSVIIAVILLTMSALIIYQNRRTARERLESETKAAAERARRHELEKTVKLQEELLERERGRDEAVKLITALSSDYWSVYYIELDKDEGVCYQERTDIEDALKLGEHFKYFETYAAYAKKYVTDAYREDFIKFITPENLKAALANSRIVSFRYMVKRGGQETYEMVRFAGVRHPEDRDDHLVHSVGSCFVDIDDETRESLAKNQVLSDALEAAERANTAKTSFLSSMSHEIRTPMNAIIGLDNIALNDPGVSEETKGYLVKIGESAQHLLSLINDILDMSRIESGRLVLKNEEFSFPRLLEVINTMFNSQCQDRGLNYECHITNQLDEYYIGDDMKLRQILINILGNAVKFTPEGGTVSMSVSCVAHYGDQTSIRFEISDTGIGMSKDFLPHIFDTFAQEDSSNTNRYGSSGLGMAITKSIVEMMNGEIVVESEKGKGTTFFVTVTLKDSRNGGASAEFEVNLADLSVLVVDDDEVDREHARLVLEQLGVACDMAASGAEAIEMVKLRNARFNPYNLILLDWRMDEMDGIECCRRIREISDNRTAIIILTAYKWDDVHSEAVEAGIDSFVAKPLFANNVIDEFRSAVIRKGLSGQETREKAQIEGSRVLLAEDVDINAEIMEMLLEMRDIKCEIASNGRIALEMFEASEPGYYDAILMDVRMPEMDGLEATRRIRALERDDARTIPIIALTANAFDEDVQRSLQAGLNAHLSKPVEPDTLFETLEQLM